MRKKYFNDAFIGNENITASFSKYGELLRLYYPCPDYRQYSDFLYMGIKVNDSNIIYLHNDINNQYKQYYTEDTNILNTEITNTYFNLKVLQKDCVMVGKDVIVKKYTFKNESNINLNINFLAYSKLLSSANNMVGSLYVDNALIQYSHNFSCTLFSNEKVLGHQLNGVEGSISSGVINDKDYIGMTSDSAISYDLGELKPGESRDFVLLMYLKLSDENVQKVIEEIEPLRRLNIDKEIKKVESYWKKFLSKHDTIKIKQDGSEYKKKMLDIYKRTILYMPFLINEKTGGILASLEVDEDRDKCGKYAYCWPRDAVMMYDALDYLNFDDCSKKFYTQYLKSTQSITGMWEQRFFTDGRLAPCWGYQIDETAISVWGFYRHYLFEEKKTGKKDINYLKTNLKMLEKAMSFLDKYTNFVLGKEEKEDKVREQLEKDYNYKDRDEIYKHTSYDLWEMNEGVHLYSLSAIYGAYKSMIQVYNELSGAFENNRLKQDDTIIKKAKYEEQMRDIKKYILENLCDKKKNVLVRNNKDNLVDISILGAIVPFEVFDVNEKIVKNTVEQINMTLRTHLGGYLRFQNDGYIGGNNPWIIATAWMAWYYKRVGNIRQENECMRFIVNSATELNLLPEQANSDLNEKWVIGLGWSHAVFIKMLIKED